MTEFKSLEKYLEQVDHYLPLKKGSEDVLAEIRGHILEKAEQQDGALSEQAVNRAIASYGEPEIVAERYLDDVRVISPVFKRHLFNYTGIVFFIHALVSFFAYLFERTVVMPPFFYISRSENIFEWIVYLPSALIFDFGLVGLILYWVSQAKKPVRLPFFRFHASGPAGEKPKWPAWIGLMILNGIFIPIFLKYGNILWSISWDRGFIPMFNEPFSAVFNLALIGSMILSLLVMSLRFIRDWGWLEMLKHAFDLGMLAYINNMPLQELRFCFGAGASAIQFISLVFALITVLAALEALRDLMRLIPKKRGAGKDAEKTSHFAF